MVAVGRVGAAAGLCLQRHVCSTGTDASLLLVLFAAATPAVSIAPQVKVLPYYGISAERARGAFGLGSCLVAYAPEECSDSAARCSHWSFRVLEETLCHA